MRQLCKLCFILSKPRTPLDKFIEICRNFCKELNFKIRQRLTTSRVEDYKNLVILAEAVEEDIQERTKMKVALEQNRGKTMKFNQP